MEGQTEEGIKYAAEAQQAAEQGDKPIEIYLRRFDHGQLLLEVGQAGRALRVLPFPEAEFSQFNRCKRKPTPWHNSYERRQTGNCSPN